MASSPPVAVLSGNRELVSTLKRLRFIGRISPVAYGLLVPRPVALDELNLCLESPITDGELCRALTEMHIEDYPGRPHRQAGGMPLYQWPEETCNPLHGSNPDGSTPGALQGDDFPIAVDENGRPELPDCLDRRRKPSLAMAA